MGSLALDHQGSAISWPAPWTGPLVRPRGVRGRASQRAAEEIKSLVLRARDGETEAFGALYDHYAGQIYRYVYVRVRIHALAEDLTSDTFVRALRRIGDFTWQGKDFGAWLVTIARNLVADHFKSSRQRLEICTPEPPDLGWHEDGPEGAILDSMTSRMLGAAIRGLGPEQRECVVLRFLYGMSIAETAAIMRKKSGAVKALQYRAMRSLARMLPQDLRT
ncbi:MAG TPA: sigma-70 family RNA polymerase sigma factor [Actinomadura sp.]|jgi:RNA polymerase sigma-70 factor (ECF subfamily)|nr:sigma-70 family RNA polymerase sigma factor [Actinomadura sp.]